MSLKQEEKRVYDIPEEEEETVKKTIDPIYLKQYVENADSHDMDRIAEYLAQEKSASKKLALGIASFIMSPVFIFLGAGMAIEYYMDAFGTFLAFAGMAAAIGFGLYNCIKYGVTKKDRQKLLDGVFVTEDIKDYMDDLSKKYQSTLIKNVVIGILLCVFCIAPVIICAITLSESLIIGGFGALFAMVAAGVYMIVTSSMTSESYKKIIFLNDYNRFRRYRKY